MIKDKVVIITGASSGIGAAAAELVASQGAKVVLGARRERALEALAARIRQQFGEAAYRRLDVTRPSENEEIVKLAKTVFGRVDVCS